MNARDTEVERFHDSLIRCQRDASFMVRFHDRFLGSRPDIAAQFAGVDLARQRTMVSASLQMVMLASLGDGSAQLYLSRIAERHGPSQLNIPLDMFDLWVECLVTTVAEVDPRFDADVERAWREMIGSGVAFMKRHFEGRAD